MTLFKNPDGIRPDPKYGSLLAQLLDAHPDAGDDGTVDVPLYFTGSGSRHPWTVRTPFWFDTEGTSTGRFIKRLYAAAIKHNRQNRKEKHKHIQAAKDAKVRRARTGRRRK